MRYETHINLREIGPVHAQTYGFRSRVRLAVACSRQALSKHRKPYISVSGGKDSIALLGVVAEAAHAMGIDIEAWAHVSDASFPGTEEVIVSACDTMGVALTLDRSPVSAYDVVGKQGERKFGKEGYFFDAIGRWVDGGYDLCFTGVRAAESRRRHKAACVKGEYFSTTVPRPHHKCQPLTWWGIDDVAAAIWHYGLPVHPIYDKLAMSQVPIRLGYVTAADWMMDSAPFLRRNYPEQFAKLAAVNPQIRNYA